MLFFGGCNMRKILLVVALLATLGFIVPQAQALSLTPGDMKIKLTDATSLWTFDGDNMIPRAQNDITPPNGFALDDIVSQEDVDEFGDDNVVRADESRSVVNVESFEYNNSPDILLADGQLTGLVYDLVVDSYTFSGGGRYITINFTGGKVALYEDDTPESSDSSHVFNPNADGEAPLLWQEDAVAGDSFATIDAMPNINLADNASLWLEAIFVPILPNGITLTTQLDLLTGSGGTLGLGYLDIVGGAGAGQFDQTATLLPSGFGYDMTMQYTLLQPPATGFPTNGFNDTQAHAGGWQLGSNDPITATIIPEPATLSLLGIGIAGLIARRRRK
jgi:hypothetical protein